MYVHSTRGWQPTGMIREFVSLGVVAPAACGVCAHASQVRRMTYSCFRRSPPHNHNGKHWHELHRQKSSLVESA